MWQKGLVVVSGCATAISKALLLVWNSVGNLYLPIEEAKYFKRIAEAHGVDTVFLVAPSTPPSRLMRILNYTSGFLYLVSVFGVTGARETLREYTLQLVNETLLYTKGKIPLAVGFGVSKPEHVRALMKTGAEGVIVGSTLVKVIEEYPTKQNGIIEEVEERTRLLKEATKDWGL